MVFDISKIIGLGPYSTKQESGRELYLKNTHVFLVLHPNTLEVRCDTKLSALLKERYETVMDSRYYGKGGIEIVLADQLSQQEIEDLIRLSYTMTP